MGWFSKKKGDQRGDDTPTEGGQHGGDVPGDEDLYAVFSSIEGADRLLDENPEFRELVRSMTLGNPPTPPTSGADEQANSQLDEEGDQGGSDAATDEYLAARLRDIEEVNRRIDESPEMQAAMDEMLGQAPADFSASDGGKGQLLRNARFGGLSYIAEPPADFQEVAPEASKLYSDGAVVGTMQGDPAFSLEKFTQALAIARQMGHRPAEARLLYNTGVAYLKLGELDKSIETLQEGRAVAEEASKELGREARKLQRFEEEVHTDRPTVDVLGTPQVEQQILVMFLEALATVYEADSQMDKAAECRNEIKKLVR
jgi:tetratricopeptide (TPR) repeat protein